MNMRNYVVVSTVIFSVVAVVHLLRFALGLSAQVGTWGVPLWVSLVAVLISASVAIWGMTLVRRG